MNKFLLVAGIVFFLFSMIFFLEEADLSVLGWMIIIITMAVGIFLIDRGSGSRQERIKKKSRKK